jgi:hypothetical protein
MPNLAAKAAWRTNMKKPTYLFFAILLIAAILTGCNFPGQNSAPAVTPFPTESGQPPAAPAEIEPTQPADNPEPTAEQPAPAEPGAEPTTDPGFPVKIIKPDGSTVEIFSKALRSLAKADIKADGKIYRGVKLSEVVAKVGLSDFKQITVMGENNTSFTLPKAQVNNYVVLYFTTKGVIQLIGTAIPKQNWVKVITSIKID